MKRYYFSLLSTKVRYYEKKCIVKTEREPELYGPNNTFGDNRNIENLIYFHLFDRLFNKVNEIVESYENTQVAIAKPMYNFLLNKKHYLIFEYGERDDDNVLYYHRSEEKFCHFMIRYIMNILLYNVHHTIVADDYHDFHYVKHQ